jgi:hypothetical protein
VTRARALTALTIGSAVLLAVIGAVYGTWAERYGNDEGELYLAFVSYLGVGALVFVATWQERSSGLVRIAVLAALVVLAGGFAAANAFAVSIPKPAPPDFLRPPRELHLAGLALGTVLYLVSLVETSFAIREERRVSPA